MTEPSPLLPPAWVYKRDGRLVPFEADKISRALFAVTENLGRPDAFLARELTDGVVHFLTADAESPVPTTAQIAELVVKVVRELGQPVLARAFADATGQRVKNAVPTTPSAAPEEAHADILLRFSRQQPLAVIQKACLRSYTLQVVFARDLVAAQGDGLLTLTGLETPGELAGCVLAPPATADRGLFESLEQVRRLTGGFLAIDGPEYVLAQRSGAEDSAVTNYVRELGSGLRATGLRAVVNLNCASPPAWADDLADGPLFAERRQAPTPQRLAALSDSLLEEIGVKSSGLARSAPRIDWHLGERDLLAANEERLLRLARKAREGVEVAFVFDRPRRPVALAEGLDRQHPAALLVVGLHLPCLAEQLGSPADPALFLQKLGSLARLTLSAATQKRDYLRRQHRDRTALTRGFLLDRARFVAAPVGLEDAVRTVVERGPCVDGAALDFAKQTIKRLRDVLRQDGRHCQMDTCLDAPADFSLDDEETGHKTGVTAWDRTAPVKSQLRVGGALHALSEMGTAAVLVSEERPPSAEQIAEWLRWTWQHTEVVRLRFVRVTEHGTPGGESPSGVSEQPRLFTEHGS